MAKTCPAGWEFCSRCHQGKTNGHGPGHRPGESRDVTLSLSAEELDVIRRALRDLRSRTRKSEAKLKAKFGAKADAKRSRRTQAVAAQIQRRFSILTGNPPAADRVPDFPGARFVHAETGVEVRAESCRRACGCYGARVNVAGERPGSRWFHPTHGGFLAEWVRTDVED